MELFSPNIKKFLVLFLKKLLLYFEKWNFFRKNFLYFRSKLSDLEKKKPTLTIFVVFWEMELSCSKLEKLLYIFSYISGTNLQSLRKKYCQSTHLYFLKINLYIQFSIFEFSYLEFFHQNHQNYQNLHCKNHQNKFLSRY